MTTRHQIMQDIILHEVVLKRKPLLDQLLDGLSTLDLLPLIRAFPKCFETMFIAADISHKDVMGILERLEEAGTAENDFAWDWLVRILQECSIKGTVTYNYR